MKPHISLETSLSAVKKEKVIQITAQSFFREMVDYGFDRADIINLTTKLLDLVIQKKTDAKPHKSYEWQGLEADYSEGTDGRVREIVSRHLHLRSVCADDLPLLRSWRDEGAYRGTLIESLFEPPVCEIVREFQEPLNRLFVVRLRDGSPLGLLAFRRDRSDPSWAEMQKFLAVETQRGHGYGSQMTHLWLQYGFTRLNLRKISARTAGTNLPNINLNRKLGFRFEAHLRHEILLGGAYVDVVIMSILRSEVLAHFEAAQTA